VSIKKIRGVYEGKNKLNTSKKFLKSLQTGLVVIESNKKICCEKFDEMS